MAPFYVDTVYRFCAQISYCIVLNHNVTVIQAIVLLTAEKNLGAEKKFKDQELTFFTQKTDFCTSKFGPHFEN